MGTASFLLSFLWLHLFLAPTPVISAIPPELIPKLRESSPSLLPNGFVVEFAQDSHASISQLRDTKRSTTWDDRKSSKPHEELYSHLRKRGANFTVRKEYDAPGLFTGSAIVLHDIEELYAVAELEGVVSIRPIVKILGPSPLYKVIPQAPNDPSVPSDSMATHRLMGVDALHALTLLGQGVKIGLIDTGVDYTHPLLGETYRQPTSKFKFGYDFVGDDFDGVVPPQEDDDPLDQCNGHGTHVAGIVAADPGSPFGISGVAYGAIFGSYRVFGCGGFTTDDVVSSALLRAVQDGVDVVNLSLGGVDGWTSSTSSVIASRIAAGGQTVVSLAAGNDGEHGSWYSASPGNAIDAISTASLDTTELNVQNATVVGVEGAEDVQYFNTFPLAVNTTEPFRIYATSNSTTVTDDACSPLPEDTPDLSEFLVLIRRGGCSFQQKLEIATRKNARVFFIYNDVEGLMGIAGVGSYVAALIDAETGAFLVSQYAAGVPIAVSFPQGGRPSRYLDPTGGLISKFTSYGPTFEMWFKPAITAPGGGILSTYPVALGSFGVLGGTSMAAPALTGAIALILQVRGTSTAEKLGIRDLLQSTAKPVLSNHTDGSPYQTLSQQGAGLVNVPQAAWAETIVRPGQLMLNDSGHFVPEHQIQITNDGEESKTFALSHEAAGTMQSIRPGSILAAVGPVPLTRAKASVDISPQRVIVGPGETKNVRVSFRPPQGRGAERETYPVYSGWIVLTRVSEQQGKCKWARWDDLDAMGWGWGWGRGRGQGRGKSAKEKQTVPPEILRVSYMGLAASIKSKTLLDTSPDFIGSPLPTLLDRDGDPQRGLVNYSFAGNDYPVLLYRLSFGTPRITIDLVNENIKYTPTIPLPPPRPPGAPPPVEGTWGSKRSAAEMRSLDVASGSKRAPGPSIGFGGPNLFSSWIPHREPSGTYQKVPILGPLGEFNNLPRNSESVSNGGWTTVPVRSARFANGTRIPNGRYKLLMRALKVTGDRGKEGDYESWLSPPFGVQSPVS